MIFELLGVDEVGLSCLFWNWFLFCFMELNEVIDKDFLSSGLLIDYFKNLSSLMKLFYLLLIKFL